MSRPATVTRDLEHDPVAALERELIRAAERQAVPPPRSRADAPVPGRPRPVSRLGTPFAVAAVLIPILLVAGVLFLTRSSSPGRPPASAATSPTTATSSPATLAGELGVLRGTQWTAPAGSIPAVVPTFLRARVDLAASRQVIVNLAGGRRAVAVDLDVLDAAGGQQLFVAGRPSSQRGVSVQGLTVTAAQLAQSGVVAPLGTAELAIVVPDGVRRVVLVGTSFATTSGPVTDNVVVVRSPRGGPTEMRWVNAAGQVIHTVGLAQARTVAASSPTAQATAPPSGDDLRSFLGVLRRPQTAADRYPGRFDPALGTPQRTEERLATTTPWGARIYLVPFAPSTGSGRILDVFARPRLTYPSNTIGFSAADIDTGQAVLAQRIRGDRGGVRVLMVVPDLVHTVIVQLQTAGEPGAIGETHGNVVALILPPGARDGRATITWRDGGGRRIARFAWRLTTS